MADGENSPNDESNKMTNSGDMYHLGLRILCLCGMWYTSSLLQNVINKHLFGEFPYPATVSMCHMLAVAVFLAPVLRLWNVPQPEVVIDKRAFYKLIIPLAFGKFFASVSAEFSILKVSVSFAHTGNYFNWFLPIYFWQSHNQLCLGTATGLYHGDCTYWILDTVFFTAVCRV